MLFPNVSVQNALISVYSSFSAVEVARVVFDMLPTWLEMWYLGIL